MAANNPRHGDAIIESHVDALGNPKLVANTQFQRYLDELATLVLADEETADTDVDQIIAATDPVFQAKLNTLQSAVSKLFNINQLVFTQDTEISQLRAQVRNMKTRIDDLEQLEHAVN